MNQPKSWITEAIGTLKDSKRYAYLNDIYEKILNRDNITLISRFLVILNAFKFYKFIDYIFLIF